jgi:hypothetical protein
LCVPASALKLRVAFAQIAQRSVCKSNNRPFTFEAMRHRSKQSDAEPRIWRLKAEIKALREKRSRVIETYLKGVISREDRDRILSTIDRDLKVAQDILMRETPPKAIEITDLIKAFAPLADFACWTRDQKRSVLAAITPDIRCADYKTESLGINPAIFSSENSHRGRDSWRRHETHGKRE